MNIRLATKDDYKEVDSLLVALHMLHVRNNPRMFSPIDYFYTKSEFEERLEKGINIFYLAEEDEKIVGLISIHIGQNDYKKIASISSLYVAPQYRNKSIATKLMQTAYKYYQENCLGDDFSRYLDLDVCDFNEVAINFYKKMGFSFIAHTMAIEF